MAWYNSTKDLRDSAVNIGNQLIGTGGPIQSPILGGGASVKAPINIGYVTDAVDPKVKPPKVKPPKVKPPKVTAPAANLPTLADRLGSTGGNIGKGISGIGANIGGGSIGTGINAIGGGQVGPRITIDSQTGRNAIYNVTGAFSPIFSGRDDPLMGGSVKAVGNLNTNDPFNVQFGNYINSVMGNGVPGSVAGGLFGGRSPGERVTGIEPEPATGDKSTIWTPNPQGVTGGGITGPNYGDKPTDVTPVDQVIFPSYDKATWEGNLPKEEKPGDAIDRRYNLLQQNLAANESRLAQGEQEALNRRFASMGAQNSGAALKNSQLQGDISNRRLLEGQNALGAAQSGEKQAAIEAANQRGLLQSQMKIASEEAKRANEIDIMKSKLGNYQFERQYGLASKELDINAQIANIAAYQSIEVFKDNARGMIQQILAGLGLPVDQWSGRQDTTKNPLNQPTSVPV